MRVVNCFIAVFCQGAMLHTSIDDSVDSSLFVMRSIEFKGVYLRIMCKVTF